LIEFIKAAIKKREDAIALHLLIAALVWVGLIVLIWVIVS
jgi:hypothetical protein